MWRVSAEVHVAEDRWVEVAKLVSSVSEMGEVLAKYTEQLCDGDARNVRVESICRHSGITQAACKLTPEED